MYFSRYDGLLYFRVTPLGAYCLGTESEYQPAPIEVKSVLQVLPNLEIAAIGAELEQADRLALDAFATQVSDFVWRLDAGRLLAAIEEGRSVVEIQEFLTARSRAPIPSTSLGCSRMSPTGARKSWTAAWLASSNVLIPRWPALIANDSRTRKHCMRAGERHLAVRHLRRRRSSVHCARSATSWPTKRHNPRETGARNSPDDMTSQTEPGFLIPAP